MTKPQDDNPIQSPYKPAMLQSLPHRLHRHKAMPWIAVGISASLLGGAWFFEHGLGYAPCIMCYWQRHVHKLILIAAILGWKFNRFGPKSAHYVRLTLIALFLLSAGIAAWHVGVEQGWLDGPKACAAATGQSTLTLAADDPLAFLDEKIAPPSCAEPLWHFLGLSMAAWNMLISLITALWIATSKP